MKTDLSSRRAFSRLLILIALASAAAGLTVPGWAVASPTARTAPAAL